MINGLSSESTTHYVCERPTSDTFGNCTKYCNFNSTTDSITSTSVTTSASITYTTGHAGLVNGAAVLDGTSSYMEFSHTPNNFKEGVDTILIWFKANSTSPIQRIISHPQTTRNNRIYLTLGSGQVSATVGQTNYILKDKLAWDTTAWHHVAIVRDYPSMRAKHYFDSVFLTDMPVTISTTSITDTFIGRLSSSEYYSGAVDDFRLYDRELNQTEISGIYNDAVDKGTVGLWVKIRADTTSTTMSYLSSYPYTFKLGTNASNYYEWDAPRQETWRDNEWQYLTFNMTGPTTTVGVVDMSDINYRQFSINTSPGSGVTSLDWIVRLNGISPSNEIGPNYLGDRRVVESSYTISVDI